MNRPATRKSANLVIPPMFILMLMEDYEAMNGSMMQDQYKDQYKKTKAKLVKASK